jgi:nitrate reductase gamma subunit
MAGVRILTLRRFFTSPRLSVCSPSNQRNLMTTTLNRILALLAVYTEKYVLSLVFFCLALLEFKKIWNFLSGRLGAETAVFMDAVHHLIMLLLYIFSSPWPRLSSTSSIPLFHYSRHHCKSTYVRGVCKCRSSPSA